MTDAPLLDSLLVFTDNSRGIPEIYLRVGPATDPVMAICAASLSQDG